MRIELASSACCLPSLNRRELFAAVARAGYSSVELFCGWTASVVKPGKDKAEDLAQDAVRVSALHLPNDVEQAQIAIDFAAGARIPCVIAHGIGSPKDASVWLRPLVRHAVKNRVDLVLTNHKGQTIESAEDVQAALDSCGDDAPGILLEAGHYWAAGLDPIAAYDRFRRHVRLIHIKDLDALGRSVAFGAGVSPLPEFLKTVASSGYAGRIVIELEIADASPQTLIGHLRDAREKVNAWVDQAHSAATGGQR